MDKIKFIPPENNKGCCEYKLKLVYGTHIPEEIKEKKLNKIASQMKYRLFQGNGKAIYILGVSDKGDVEGIEEYELEESILFIENACKRINANIYKKRIYKGNNGFICTLRIELLNKEDLEHDFI
jgi:elongation factor 1-alpha